MANHFDVVRLGDVASVRSGFAFSSRDWVDAGIPVVKIGNVRNGTLVMDNCSFVSRLVAADAGDFNLKNGDIVISMTGHIGNVAMARDRDLPVVVNQRVGLFSIPDPTRVDRRFLFYSLRYRKVRERIEGLGYGSVQPNVSPSLLHGVDVPLPPVAEQRAIAHFLGTLDDKIELNRRMNETLDAMARALFKSWFVDLDPVRAKMEGRDTGLPPDIADLFPDRLVDSEMGEVPEGWEVRTLGDLIELAYGKSLPKKRRRSGDVPVYGSNGQIGWHDQKLIDGPGIVVGRKGNPGSVRWCQTGLFPIDTTFYVVPKDDGRGMFFLYHLLRTQDLPSIASDSAVPGMNRNLAYMNTAVLPTEAVTGVFTESVKAISTRQSGLGKESRILAALRDILLPKLISGEIRVPDAERALETAT